MTIVIVTASAFTADIGAGVQDRQVIIGYGVTSTPTVVIDGTVAHAGGVPRAN